MIVSQNCNSLGFPKAPEDTKVVVAMSGGVDSSVVAAHLSQQGYQVFGITLQLYDQGQQVQRQGSCCAGQDIYDARQVAARLNIPHYILNYEKQFQEQVIKPFTEAYLAGETPIPCVFCNQHIKFSDLLTFVQDLKADTLATGHYVTSSPDTQGLYRFYRGLDPARDQSYFLFATTQEQLQWLRFPLGNFFKAQVRDLAALYGLKIARKPDSQDICFVPEGKYMEIVEKLNSATHHPGDIVHVDGHILGRHQGIANYTIGQRRRLNIAFSEPLYVVKIEAAEARVIVGPRSALKQGGVILRDVNWIGQGFHNINHFEDIPGEGVSISVRIRSQHPPFPAQLLKSQNKIKVRFPTLQEGLQHNVIQAAAPGQACVFYDSALPQARILGGGFIQSTFS